MTELADLDRLGDPDSEADLDDIDHDWVRPEWEFFFLPPPDPEPALTAPLLPAADSDTPPF